MAWLFDYLKIAKSRNFCLNYFCGTCGASEYSAGLVFRAYKSLKKIIPNKVEFNNEIPTSPIFRDLKLSNKKECFEEISYQLSLLQKNQIKKIQNENKSLCPIKFIFLVALNENFENILLDKITYTPVHEFYLEYQKEILQSLYYDIDLEVVDVTYNIVGYWLQQQQDGMIGSKELDIKLNTLSNVCESVNIFIKVHKPGRFQDWAKTQ